MEKFRIVVEFEDEGNRIDKYLSSVLEDLTRTKIQNLIKDEKILVNDLVVSSSYKVKEDDEIIVNVPKIKPMTLEAENIPLDIIYEDDDLLVVNKQKGLVVHPASGNHTGTLVNALLYHFKELSNNDDELRPGIVHRIDKNTTGCIIVCKNDKAHLDIANQIREKTCKRTYTALVHGVIEHETGTINAPIGRSKNDRQKMSVTEVNSKDAVTHFKVLKRFYNMTLVECELETGRTHQIRVHMQYINHPVVGDDKYSFANTRKDTLGQMLHASKIQFIHPTTKKLVVVETKLPEYFLDILKEIENS